mgnify:CR=1 FL=1
MEDSMSNKPSQISSKQKQYPMVIHPKNMCEVYSFTTMLKDHQPVCIVHCFGLSVNVGGTPVCSAVCLSVLDTTHVYKWLYCMS